MKTKIEAHIVLNGFKPVNTTKQRCVKLSTDHVNEIECALNSLETIALKDGTRATIRFHFQKEIE